MTLEEVNAKAIAHAKKVLELAASGQVKWTVADVPRPEAMRAFLGIADGYMVHVVQANTVETGIMHMATITATKDFMVANMPPEIANDLYHRAAASQN